MPRPESPPVEVARWRAGAWEDGGDQVAAEEPLQILVDGRAVSIVMRTPGADLELVLGLLLSEGVIRGREDVESLVISAEAGETEPRLEVLATLIESNRVDVRLRGGPRRSIERSFLSSSACGVCGATTLESLAVDFAGPAPGDRFEAALLPGLPAVLRAGQGVFERTGGLHAAGLFDAAGELLHLREDIGRHNAVDKVAGRLLLDGGLPARGRMLLVSGRAGYELVQKAVAAGIPLLAAVGAPSSLAVATAQRFGVTLVGFLRGDRFNVYCGPERLR